MNEQYCTGRAAWPPVTDGSKHGISLKLMLGSWYGPPPLGALPQKHNLCHGIQFVVYLDYVKFNWNGYTVKETDCQELASEEVGITEGVLHTEHCYSLADCWMSKLEREWRKLNRVLPIHSCQQQKILFLLN